MDLLTIGQEFPIQIALPLQRLEKSTTYFKKLHLISDVLLGFFRLYGHAVLSIADDENVIPESLEQSI